MLNELYYACKYPHHLIFKNISEPWLNTENSECIVAGRTIDALIVELFVAFIFFQAIIDAIFVFLTMAWIVVV